MTAPTSDSIVAEERFPFEGSGAITPPSEPEVNEKTGTVIDNGELGKDGVYYHTDEADSDVNSDDVVIITGEDAANHLLPMRDDFDTALTFRSMVIGTALSAFQATMNQIYMWKPTTATIGGTFITLIAYFMGKAWANLLPRGDKFEARWRAKGGQGPVPMWIRVVSFFNYGKWGLKEHAVAAICATSASQASVAIEVFAAGNLFYNVPLNAGTVILSVISIGLFGYGLCGIMRPFAVWHVDSVYWSTIPTVKTLQSLHWADLKNSKPLRVFWYSFAGMSCYEWFPAYIWPWLNSVSVPCLAAMHATGEKAAVLTNIFGGSLNNEGLGLFSFSFDWQYITSFNTSLPLILQAHSLAGFIVCYVVMIGIYYGNGWDAKSQPFMSTRLRMENGTAYPIDEVFINGVLDENALAAVGPPRLSGSFAYAMFMANAAIGALIAHCILFWGKDVVNSFRSASKNQGFDRHHEHMAKHYKETPWWWYVAVLVVAFVLGIVVVVKEGINLPVWAYIVSLIVGSIISPFSTILYAKFGNGIATNNLSKMIAGLLIPGRPVGNMYFAAWSHNVISDAVQLSNDLKMGEYLKVPPRVMFLTQLYATILGGFINYGVMISIIAGKKDLLANTNGNASWSGVQLQSYNTNATSWALSKYLYKVGAPYAMVPIGLAIGAAVVVVHRIVVQFVPKIRGFSLYQINFPQFIQFAGYIPYNQSQTCVIWSQLATGFFTQFYVRNYYPRIFKDYSYLIASAFDGGSWLILFILSFAVFGAGGTAIPFPNWWGNNANGNYDLCPIAE